MSYVDGFPKNVAVTYAIISNTTSIVNFAIGIDMDEDPPVHSMVGIVYLNGVQYPAIRSNSYSQSQSVYNPIDTITSNLPYGFTVNSLIKIGGHVWNIGDYYFELSKRVGIRITLHYMINHEDVYLNFYHGTVDSKHPLNIHDYNGMAGATMNATTEVPEERDGFKWNLDGKV